MPSDRKLTIIIAALAVFALAAGAASIGNPVAIEGADEPDERLFEPPDYADDTGEVGTGDDVDTVFGWGDESFSVCVPFLMDRNTQLVIVLSMFLGAGIIWKLSNFIVTAAFMAGFGPAITIAYFVLISGCEQEEEEEEDPEEVEGFLDFLVGDNGNTTAAQVVDVATDPTMIFAALVIIGIAAFAFVMMTDDEDEDVEPDEEYDKPSTSTLDQSIIAEIAGEAADRIEEREADDDKLENEVYRAWRQMTEHLEVAAPETSTPGDFAREAIAAGMSTDDVMALTELFEEVRYGDRYPTDERERAAVETLRNIERTYGAGDET